MGYRCFPAMQTDDPRKTKCSKAASKNLPLYTPRLLHTGSGSWSSRSALPSDAYPQASSLKFYKSQSHHTRNHNPGYLSRELTNAVVRIYHRFLNPGLQSVYRQYQIGHIPVLLHSKNHKTCPVRLLQTIHYHFRNRSGQSVITPVTPIFFNSLIRMRSFTVQGIRPIPASLHCFTSKGVTSVCAGL